VTIYRVKDLEDTEDGILDELLVLGE